MKHQLKYMNHALLATLLATKTLIAHLTMMPRFPFHLFILVVVSRFFLAALRFSFLRSDFVQTTVTYFKIRCGRVMSGNKQPLFCRSK